MASSRLLVVLAYIGTLLWWSLVVPIVEAFAKYQSFGGRISHRDTFSSHALRKNEDVASASTPIQIRSYQHDGWNLTYRYKPADPGFDTPLLLVHPVGIGLSSWFWEPLMNQTGAAAYAPDLIGCGISDGADAWKPDQRALSVPLGWVEGCEALMQQEILPRNSGGCIVVTQGGLAPIGLLLAARNPNTVKGLVLASPPTFQEMTTALSEQELERNYHFYRHPLWGRLAFSILESRRAVEFFSNLFLFASACDEVWLDQVLREACAEARPPVQVFNAGFCMHRSYESEWTALQQPVWILQGQVDSRSRGDYAAGNPKRRLQTLPGKNALPWESAERVAAAVERAFFPRMK